MAAASQEERNVLKNTEEKLEGIKFEYDFSKDIGFEKALKNREKKDGFYMFAIEIPSYEEKSKYDPVEMISASLLVITSLIEFHNVEVKRPEKQEIIFKTGFRRNASYGGWIAGQVSADMTNWLKSFEKYHHCKEIVETMISVGKKLAGEEISPYGFDARFSSGGFVIDCPGNACGLNPANWHDLEKENKGHEFNCHNTDYPTQQLFLLAGLAKMCDMYREFLRS